MLRGINIGEVWGVWHLQQEENNAASKEIKSLCKSIMMPKNCAMYVFYSLLLGGLTVTLRTGFRICFSFEIQA